MIKYFIIDFDSTFVQSEGLEELASVALANNPNRKKIINQIKKITNLGMEGRISFDRSLATRLKLLHGNKLHIYKVVEILRGKISPSIKRNRQFFRQYKENIYIISGGFKEFILPIVKPFSLNPDNVFANSFRLDKFGKITGLDKNNPLSKKDGKVKTVIKLGLRGEVIVVGDGFTDYQIKAMGAAKHFVAFTENIRREAVVKNADHEAPNFDEFLFVNRIPSSLSYPKNRIKAHLPVTNKANIEKLFTREGYALIGEKTAHQTQIAVVNNLSTRTRQRLIKMPRLNTVGILADSDKKFYLDFLTLRGIAVFQGSDKEISKKIISYINSGDTQGSPNIPNIRFSKKKKHHRLLHLHKNVPGILANLNGVMAKYKLNILSQYLKTNAKIGYAITDVNKKYDQKVLHELRKIPDTIRFRVLY